MEMLRRHALTLAAALALVLAPSAWLAWTVRNVPHFGYFQDDGLYWIGAKSLATGQGYRILSLPGDPFQTKYPPGYPLLLAAVWKLDPSFPHNLRWALLGTWLLLPAYLLLCWHLTRRWEVLLLAGLSPALIFLSLNIMPEILFACLVLSALLAAERGRPILAGLLVGAAYLTKTAALAALAAIFLGWLLRRQWRTAMLFLVPSLPAVLSWNLWVRTHASPARDFGILYYTDYLGLYFVNISWRDLPRVVETNVALLLKAAGAFLFFNAPDLLCWIAAAAAIWGIARLSRENKVRFRVLFAAFYSLMLIVWHFPPNERFLIPLFPLLAAGFCRAMDGLRQRRALWASLAAAGIGLWWMLCVWKGTGEELPRIFHVARERQEAYRAAFAALVQSCPAGEPVLAYQDTLVYLYTARPAVRPVVPSRWFYRNDPAALWRIFRNIDDYARQYGASCLLSTAGDYQTDSVISDHAAMEAIFAGNPRLRIVYQSDSARIYRIAR